MYVVAGTFPWIPARALYIPKCDSTIIVTKLEESRSLFPIWPFLIHFIL